MEILVYYEGRQYDQGIQECVRAVEMDPIYVPAPTNLAMIYMKTGQYAKVISRLQRAKAVTGEQGIVLSYLAQAQALSGNKVEARKILNTLEKPGSPLFVSAWDRALIYTALDDKDKALTFLEKAVEQHVGWVVRLGVDPALDNMRAEPRFKELERRVHIPAAAIRK